jgi:long-chain acyl-CoA synthetase
MQYPEVPVGAILAGSARRFGERTAVHYYGRDLTFAGLYARAAAFAQALGAAGIGRGDVVALHLPNCPQYPIAYYGTLLAGATFSPANPLLPPADLAAQLADCGAVAAVTW